jgi:hypothetical protein
MEEQRASTCGFLQAWVLPGLRAGSSGFGWRQVTAHVYSLSLVNAPGPRQQDGNKFASHVLGRRNVQGL